MGILVISMSSLEKCLFRFSTHFLKFTYLFIHLFIFECVGLLLLHAGLSLAAVSGGHSPLQHASHCSGLSHCRAQAPGARAPAVVMHELSCSAACGILLDKRLNLCPLNWEADSPPLHHQGSPICPFFNQFFGFFFFQRIKEGEFFFVFCFGFLKFNFIYLFIYLWLCWVFVSV